MRFLPQTIHSYYHFPYLFGPFLVPCPEQQALFLSTLRPKLTTGHLGPHLYLSCLLTLFPAELSALTCHSLALASSCLTIAEASVLLSLPPHCQQRDHSVTHRSLCLQNPSSSHFLWSKQPRLLSRYAKLLPIWSISLSSLTTPYTPAAWNSFFQSGRYTFLCQYPATPSLCPEYAISFVLLIRFDSFVKMQLKYHP